MKKFSTALAAFALMGVLTVGVRADVASATKYIDEATELVGKGQQFFADATAKLELADASMDDVPDAAKPALKAKIDGLKAQIASAAGAEDKAKIQRQFDRLMQDTEESIGNMATWPGNSDKLTELLNDPATTAALGEPAVTAAKKKFATFAKVHGGKALKTNLATATDQVAELEKSWAEHKTKLAETDATPEGRTQELDSAQRDFDGIARFFKDLPADNADVKALQARVDKVKSEMAAAAGNASVAEVVRRIDSYLDLYKNEYDGMEAETTTPSWASYKSSANSDALGVTKTKAFYSRMGEFLTTLQKEDAYVAAKDQPAVKAKVADLQKRVAAAHDTIKKNAEAVVAGLEAEKVNASNAGRASQLHDEVRNALGESTDEGKGLMARIDKVNADFKNAGEKANANKDAYYKSLTEQANKAWPDMASKFQTVDGFDPNKAADFKGKYVKFIGNNLIGWHYKTGDFDYATQVNGLPVAGHYDPAIKAAIKEVEAKLGRQIGDDDNDGEWTVIARVEGSTGQLTKMERRSGDVTVDGSKVGTVESTVDRPMDAPIVTVVAVKAGPVAAAAGQGAVKEDGSISAPIGSTGSHGISFSGIIFGLLAVVVGAGCLMKSKFAPLAGNAGAAQVAEKIGGDNLAYLGLAGLIVGIIGVLMNLLAIPQAFFHALIGILASAAMVVAGTVVSRDFLESKALMPGNIVAQITPFAIPAGLACAALGVLTILVSL